jgi:hypothetical protein
MEDAQDAETRKRRMLRTSANSDRGGRCHERRISFGMTEK